MINSNYTVEVDLSGNEQSVSVSGLSVTKQEIVGTSFLSGPTGPQGPPGTPTDATTSAKGIVKLAGDLAGTADLPTVPGLATKADTTALTSHTSNTSNPHATTKAQVGLGNVDNTSDLSKPVSTATQSALDTKVQIGGDIGGTISTPVVKSRSVAVTVGLSGADYTMSNLSDHGTINNAISAVSALGGGTVLLKRNNYTPTDHIRLKENVTLVGENGTILTPSQSKGIIFFESNTGMDNIQLDAINHIVNNMAVQIADNGAATLKNVFIRNSRLLNCCFGIFTAASNGSVVSNIRVTNNFITGRGNNDLIGGGPVGAGVNLATGIIKDFVAEGNTVKQDSSIGNNYKFALDMVKVADTRFINNTVEGGVIFGSEQSPHTNSIISGNTIKNPNGYPTAQVGFLVDSASTTPGTNIIVSNNTIENGFIGVINSNSSVFMPNVLVIGNIINANGVSFANGEAGIKASNLDGLIVENNIVNGSTGDGIWLSNCKTSTVISNNVTNSTLQGIKENNNSQLNSYANNYTRGNVAGNFSINSSSIGYNVANVNPELYYTPGDTSGAITLRRTNGHTTYFKAIGNITVTIQPGVVLGEKITLSVLQDSTGGRSITWSGSNFKFSSLGTFQLSGVANELDSITLEWNSSIWFEVSRSSSVFTFPGLANKVDKVAGKQLSTEDYTTADMTRLSTTSGTNTGDQTSVSGNAGTATKLATARAINGVSFDGTAAITVADALKLAIASNLSDLANVATARTNLGLGTIALLNSVSLTSNVSGILPVANGGTGSSSVNFVDLTTTQAVAGSKNFTDTISFSKTGYKTAINGAARHIVLEDTSSTYNTVGWRNYLGDLLFYYNSGGNLYHRFMQTGLTGFGVNTDPTSTLVSGGSFATAVTTVTTATTLSASHFTIRSNLSTALTHTLPTAVGVAGRIYTIKSINTGVVTIATTSSQTIDGATTYSLATQYKYVTVQSNGANWDIVGNN